MPSTFSQLLRVELQAVGENETTWGDKANANFSTVLEQAIAGKADIVMSDTNYTLTQRFGEADEARQAMLFVTGNCTAVRSVIVPRLSKHYIVRNLTTGGFELEVRTETGQGTRVANGKAKLVFCDGSNVQDATGGTVDAGVVSPSSITSTANSWVFRGTVGVNRSNNVDSNYGTYTADGPLGSYSAYYANGTLTGQLTATTNSFMMSSAIRPLMFSCGGENRMTITTSGAVQVHNRLDAQGLLNVLGDTTIGGTLFGGYAAFQGEVEAGSYRVRGQGPTIFMQETDTSATRTMHMNGNQIGFTLTVAGWAFYSASNGNAWCAGSLTQSSDDRKKQDWSPMAADFIERMAQVRRGTYTRTDLRMRQVGVSAQSVEQVLPEAVTTDEQGYKSVAYSNAALVLAIELANKVLDQDERMNALEARLAALESM